jgi:hypothetical protein
MWFDAGLAEAWNQHWKRAADEELRLLYRFIEDLLRYG